MAEAPPPVLTTGPFQLPFLTKPGILPIPWHMFKDWMNAISFPSAPEHAA